MKTLGFNATFGLIPGYNHDNAPRIISLYDFGILWHHHMESMYSRKDILVGCVSFYSRTIYPIKFGCPVGGEETITVTGHYNPNFFPFGIPKFIYLRLLKRATIQLCDTVRRDLKQTTLSLTFYKVDDFIYLKNGN